MRVAVLLISITIFNLAASSHAVTQIYSLSRRALSIQRPGTQILAEISTASEFVQSSALSVCTIIFEYFNLGDPP